MSAAPRSGPDPWTGFADPADATLRLAELTRHLAGGGASVAIGTTPRAEIWRDGKVSLHRFDRAEPPRLPPVLIVHGLVGRHTISDLQPGRSMVGHLLAAGADVFVIDWGDPGPEDQFKDFTDYAEIHLADALARVAEASGRDRAAILGICQGGVFALCHAARHPDRLLGVVTAITPVDFHADMAGDADGQPHADGLLNHWIRNLPVDLIEGLIADRGTLSGRLTGALFHQLAPARTLAKYTSGLAALAADRAALDTFLRMEAWLADRPDMPGAAAREWLVGLYQQNRLAQGSFRIAGAPVGLGAITCPVLNVFGTQDHIVPPACSRALRALVPRSRYDELEVPTGHAGVFVSRKAQSVVAPRIAAWLATLLATLG